ncbi:MAG TPA: response regulator [Chitinophagales bacterium]|nr:response regulator [Chitinophagales bacterium]
MNSAEILVIDDELQIRRLLTITLESNGYRVNESATAREGLVAAANHPPDLILLDLGLPDESGHSVLKQLREWYDRPVIILSVQSSEEDIVSALDHGANDYLVKPFRTAELLARIRSALRNFTSEENSSVIDCNDFIVDLTARTVKKNEAIIKLTATEYSLLAVMVKNEGKVLTHQFLLQQVWGPDFINESQYLRVFVAQLRKKIELNPDNPKHLITESGVGYRFVAT